MKTNTNTEELRQEIQAIDRTFTVDKSEYTEFLLPNYYLDRLVDFVHQKTIEARQKEVEEVPDYGLSKPDDYACYELNHSFNQCVKCYKEMRIAELQASLNTEGEDT